MARMPDAFDMQDADDNPDEPQEHTHTCRKCGKTGLWWQDARENWFGTPKRMLFERRPRGHNGPHQCVFTDHFEYET